MIMFLAEEFLETLTEIAIVCLTAQWVTAGRIAWAFARDVSAYPDSCRSTRFVFFLFFGTNNLQFDFIARCSIFQLLRTHRSILQVPRPNNRGRLRFRLLLWPFVSGVDHRIQLDRHRCRTVPQHHLRRPSRDRSVPGPQKAPPEVSQPWLARILLQRLFLSLDCDSWCHGLLPTEHPDIHRHDELHQRHSRWSLHHIHHLLVHHRKEFRRSTHSMGYDPSGKSNFQGQESHRLLLTKGIS